MNKIEALELELKARKMVKGTGVEWWSVIKYGDPFDFEPNFDSSRSAYELALGIIEGKPVWSGNKLYIEGVEVKRIIFTQQCFDANKSAMSWNPPAQKTETFEHWWESEEFGAPISTHSMYFARMGWGACRKALKGVR